MDISSEKHRKRKKLKKTKKERKTGYRSDSTGSDRSHKSPSIHKGSNRKSASPSSSRKRRSPSSSHKHHSPDDKNGNIVSYSCSSSPSPSPPPSPEQYHDVKVKQEVKQEPSELPHLFGSYICEVIYFS